jgi:hypothetical protein
MDLRRKGLGADGISVIVPPLPSGIFASAENLLPN